MFELAQELAIAKNHQDVPAALRLLHPQMLLESVFGTGACGTAANEDTIHRPGSHRIVEAQPWFAFLDRHHYIHHVALGTNLNFLLPLADLLFGTLRRQLTPGELARHGPLERAKARPAGQGERARAAMG